MKTRFISFLFILIGVAMLSSCADAVSESVSNADLKDQVKLTIYNSNLGLVNEIRTIELQKGEGDLEYRNVSSQIRPETVQVQVLNDPNSFRILEQNYEFDLIGKHKLLEKYVGKTVKIRNPKEFQDTTEIIEAKLLTERDGGVYQINDEIHLGYPGYVVLSEIPENLRSKPTLVWKYLNEGNLSRQFETTYLTSGMGWKADYVLKLDEVDTASLSGWVTLTNNSGASFDDAELKLVAGDVNQVVQNNRYKGAPRAMMAMEAQADVQGHSFFEYHIYDVERKTTIKNNQTKQIRLLGPSMINIRKELIANSGQAYLYMRSSSGELDIPVRVEMVFQNSKQDGLGMALPQGIVRVYQEDFEGQLQFAGEDSIKHTPKDEEVRLNIGKSFDVTAKKKQLDYRKITTKLHESEWQIKVANHKASKATIKLNETLPANWRILETTDDYKKIDAFRIQFNIELEADETKIIRFRVQSGIR